MSMMTMKPSPKTIAIAKKTQRRRKYATPPNIATPIRGATQLIREPAQLSKDSIPRIRSEPLLKNKKPMIAPRHAIVTTKPSTRQRNIVPVGFSGFHCPVGFSGLSLMGVNWQIDVTYRYLNSCCREVSYCQQSTSTVKSFACLATA